MYGRYTSTTFSVIPLNLSSICGESPHPRTSLRGDEMMTMTMSPHYCHRQPSSSSLTHELLPISLHSSSTSIYMPPLFTRICRNPLVWQAYSYSDQASHRCSFVRTLRPVDWILRVSPW